MQETWTFQCGDNCKQTELEEILAKGEKELGIFLSHYFKKQGAIAEKVRLKGKIDFTGHLSGMFVLDFDLIYFNACLNIHEKERDSMKIDFVIDPSSNELTLKGEYWPEREADEL